LAEVHLRNDRLRPKADIKKLPEGSLVKFGQKPRELG